VGRPVLIGYRGMVESYSEVFMRRCYFEEPVN